MIWMDWVFLGVIIISVITAFFRGAVRETVGLAAWAVGAYLAFKYTPNLQHLLDKLITTPEFRYIVMFLIILIIFIILGAILGKIMGHGVSLIGLSFLDKMLGSIFGLARGVLLVVIFIMMAHFTPIVKDETWKKSWFITEFSGPADQLLAWIEQSGMLPETSETQKR